MDEGACGEFTTDSMVRGHHVYQEVWIPITGEYDSTDFTSLLASLMASLLKCSFSDPSGSGSNSSRDCFLAFKYFSNTMCSSRLREMIVGKLSRLPDQPRKPRKFSPSNDLPCTVFETALQFPINL